MDYFGEGTSRVGVYGDGRIEDSCGNFYTPEKAREQAYDLEKEGFLRVAKNLRDAARLADKRLSNKELEVPNDSLTLKELGTGKKEKLSKSQFFDYLDEHPLFVDYWNNP